MGQMENEVDSFSAQSRDTDIYVLEGDEEGIGGKVVSRRESCLVTVSFTVSPFK